MKLKNILAIACIIAFIGTMPAFAAKIPFKDNALASYYGAQYHGRQTASGEIFDMYGMTAAHKTLPFGTMLEITNLETGNSVVVRVNDRGPFIEPREIDVSLGAAEKLGMTKSGVARVSISILNDNEVNPSTGFTGSPNTVSQAALPAQSYQSYPMQSSTVSEYMQAPAQPYANTAGQYSGAASGWPYSGTANNSYANTASSPYSGATSGWPYAGATSYTDPNSPLWRIQLGAFSREENAIRLVRILRAAGIEPAYERSDETIRVVIPAVEERNLESVKSVLREAGIYDYILRRER